MAKALIVVDLQNDFYEEGPLAVPGASEINQKVNKLLKKSYKFIHHFSSTLQDSSPKTF